jgi:hypothetical protein
MTVVRIFPEVSSKEKPSGKFAGSNILPVPYTSVLSESGTLGGCGGGKNESRIPPGGVTPAGPIILPSGPRISVGLMPGPKPKSIGGGVLGIFNSFINDRFGGTIVGGTKGKGIGLLGAGGIIGMIFSILSLSNLGRIRIILSLNMLIMML